MELKGKIDLINNNLLKMFELTISYLNNAFSYYKDEKNTDEEKINDDLVDKLERQVEEDCLLVILKERPFASDLRKVTGIFKLVEDIERLGDHAEDIAWVSKNLYKAKEAYRSQKIARIIEVALSMVNDAYKSLASDNPDLAKDVIKRDDIVDSLYLELLSEIPVDNIINMNKSYLIYSLEDDRNISHIISLALSKQGYEIQSFYNFADFITHFKERKPNMILLDLMLPDATGEEILKQIRSDESNDAIQIIIISAKNLTINKIDGLDLGADDYIAKPFDILELISRVNARARRQIKKENYNIRNISFDATNNNFLINNEVIHFTNSEFKIFHLLFKRKGEPVTRDEFFSMLWGSEKSYETRILDMHIKEIRKKIGKDNADLIQTIYGVGYKMKNE